MLCLFALIGLSSCNNSADAQKVESSGVHEVSRGSSDENSAECFDEKYKFLSGNYRSIFFRLYPEVYGQGNEPIPFAKKCSGDIGVLKIFMPDKALSGCVSELFDVDRSTELSQYLFDQVVDIKLVRGDFSRCGPNVHKIADLEGMQYFRNLRFLEIDSDSLQNVDQLREMPFLRSVDFRNSVICDATPFLDLENIQVVHVKQPESADCGFALPSQLQN